MRESEGKVVGKVTKNEKNILLSSLQFNKQVFPDANAGTAINVDPLREPVVSSELLQFYCSWGFGPDAATFSGHPTR